MKKSSKSKGPAAPKVDPYLEGLVAKLVDRLMALEKKMDVVVSQTAHRPVNGNQPARPAIQQPPQQPPRRDRMMYEAVCADCSKVCEVPFRPTEDRAVYCKTCFAQRKSGGTPHGMPVLTPVAMPQKPESKLNALFTPATVVSSAKQTKKSKAPKKKKR